MLEPTGQFPAACPELVEGSGARGVGQWFWKTDINHLKVF
jgi:hypothetical protein